MTDLLNTAVLLLAEAGEPAAADPGAGGGGGLGPMLLLLAPFAILFFFFVLRPQQKQQNEHRRMLDNLSKNDKVMTAGGIIGTVTNVNRDKGIVTIRVDDNATIQFALGSITRVIVDEKSEDQDTN